MTKLYTVMFSTFWLLFISSFIGTKIGSARDAQNIYSNVMMASVILGTVSIPLVGRFADKCNPQFSLPIAFFVRLITIVMFFWIDDPSDIYCYCTSCAMILGTIMENMTVDCLLLRKADPKIRGVLYSTAVAFGYCGLFVFSLVGGLLFDAYGPYMPFVFVGALDLVFGVSISLLAYFGVVKNDLEIK